MISHELELWIRSTWKECVELTAAQKLIGGISSSIYRVDIRNQASGGVKSFALRVVLPSDGLNEEQGILAQEAVVLKQLAALSEAGLLEAADQGTDRAVDRVVDRAADSEADREADSGVEQGANNGVDGDSSKAPNKTLEQVKLNVSFPRCIAYDASGECASVPALLMTFLQGKVSLPSEPSYTWLQELARAISPVHRATAHRSVVPWNYYRYAANGLDRHPAFQWSKRPECWTALIEHVSQPEPSYVPCLIHRDYHPTNVLWDVEQQRILGIVDWVNGCVGPAGVDVGHCRINLVQLYGLQAANDFLEAYMLANPTFHYDPYWDICCLIDMTCYGPIEVYEGWTMLGFQGLTAEVIQQRIEQYVEDLVQLLHTNRYKV